MQEGKIKNYTSKVPAYQSIMKIEQKLVGVGVRTINKEYDDNGKVKALIFMYRFNDNDYPFKLPAKVDEVYQVLITGKKRLTTTQEKTIRGQSERTAWKILLDWVEVQVAMITVSQVQFMQVFLPYAYDINTGLTFFEKIQNGDFKLLNQPT
jgi:hypothetical protein